MNISNINIDQVLQSLQDFRSQLSVWGVNNQILWAAAGVAAVLFLLSFREVACWFFRVHSVRDEVYGLRKQIADLQRGLNEMRDEMAGAGSGRLTPLKPEELLRIAEGMRESSASTKFRLDH